jgi:hypothetical protein
VEILSGEAGDLFEAIRRCPATVGRPKSWSASQNTRLDPAHSAPSRKGGRARKLLYVGFTAEAWWSLFSSPFRL